MQNVKDFKKLHGLKIQALNLRYFTSKKFHHSNLIFIDHSTDMFSCLNRTRILHACSTRISGSVTIYFDCIENERWERSRRSKTSTKAAKEVVSFFWTAV